MVDARSMLELVGAIMLPLSGGFALGMATAKDVKNWYAKLQKPSWNPPNWLFGPVWTVMYICMGIASWLVYRQGGWPKQKEPLTLYLVQLALNFLWTPLFFKLHQPALALAEMIVLLAFVLMTMQKFAAVIGTGVTVALMGPYVVWASFATALTYSIMKLNPQAPGKERHGTGQAGTGSGAGPYEPLATTHT